MTNDRNIDDIHNFDEMMVMILNSSKLVLVGSKRLEILNIS